MRGETSWAVRAGWGASPRWELMKTDGVGDDDERRWMRMWVWFWRVVSGMKENYGWS